MIYDSYDNGSKNCCKYCKSFSTDAINIGKCLCKNKDIFAWNDSCEKYEYHEIESNNLGKEWKICSL